MPLPLPLHIRVGLEYASVVGINAALAALYAEVANANFFFALALGLSLVAGAWVLLKIWPTTRAHTLHVLTFLAVVATAALIFWVV